MRLTQPYLKAVCFFLIFWICPAALPHQTTQAAKSKKAALSNQEILAMVRVQFPDSTIIKAIQVNDTDFDLSAGALVTLKSSGVSQPVIDAMLAAGSKTKEAASQNGHMTVEALGTNPGDLLGEVGVYVVHGSKLASVEPEIVNWRTGGVLKSIATVGLDKGHVKWNSFRPDKQIEFGVAAAADARHYGVLFPLPGRHISSGVSALASLG